MPQRVIIVYSCSLCSGEFDSAEKTTPYKLSGNGSVLDLDICAACQGGHAGFLSLLDAGITDHEPAPPKAKPSTPRGRAPALTRNRASAEVACEYCSEWFSAQGIGLHQQKAHNVKSKTAAMVEARGTGPLKCPDCGFGAKAMQGLVAHRIAAHDYKDRRG